MKIWKIVSGVISIILFIAVLFVSCNVGVVNVVEETGESGGTSGTIMAFIFLAGGIISIATRNSRVGGNIAVLIIYGIGAIIGFATSDSSLWSKVWGILCAICAIVALIGLLRKNKPQLGENSSTESN